ncbi:DUF2283 domain-containing protein [Candidatus Bathyarchaeota archaeon]|nr:DUF2283 domain-containing protein [Candidatus Bathyarchaeota archaeon]
MRVNYDAEEDILYIVIREEPIVDSKEIDEDIRVEYNLEGEIAGIEIMNARNIARIMAKEIAAIINK